MGAVDGGTSRDLLAKGRCGLSNVEITASKRRRANKSVSVRFTDYEAAPTKLIALTRNGLLVDLPPHDVLDKRTGYT